MQDLYRRLPHRAIRASGGLALTGGVFQLSLFVATVLVARSLGRSELGRYSVAIAIGTVVVGGIGGGLPVFALRETASGRIDQRFVRQIVRTDLVVTGIAAAVAALLGALLLGGTKGLVLGAIAGASSVFLNLVALLNAIHAGLHRFRTAAIGFVASGFTVTACTVASLGLHLGTRGAVASVGVSQAMLAAWLWLGLRDRLPIDAGTDSSRLFARSRALMGAGLMNGGYQRVDSLLVLTVKGAATAGIYNSAYRMLGPFSLLSSGFGTVFFARLAGLEPAGLQWHEMRRRATRLLVVVMLPLLVVVFAFMPVIVRTVYGPVFGPAVVPARVLILSLIPTTLYLPGAHSLNAAGRERTFLLVVALAIAVQIPLMLLLTSRYGATGAAVAWLTSEVLGLIGVTRAVAHPGRLRRAAKTE
jgi:O-antigen/teichoic acid export membrane protein